MAELWTDLFNFMHVWIIFCVFINFKNSKTSLEQYQVILTVPTKKSPEWYCLQRFSQKSLKIQYYSRLSQVLLCSPILSCVFPGFFLDFPEQWDQKKGVFSRSRQFGKCPPVASCLVSFKTSSGPQTSIRDTQFQNLFLR